MPTAQAKIVRIKIRWLGTGVTHLADVPDTIIQFYSPDQGLRIVTPPAAALCGTVLGETGTAPVMVILDHVAVNCPACVKVADVAPVPSPH